MKDAFKALADPTRREILILLKKRSMTVGEIVANFDISMASISQHLKILTNAELVRSEKKGKYIYYHLHTTIVDDLINWMINLKE